MMFNYFAMDILLQRLNKENIESMICKQNEKWLYTLSCSEQMQVLSEPINSTYDKRAAIM